MPTLRSAERSGIVSAFPVVQWLILQTDAQGAWYEHDLHALTAQQKADCVVLNPEKSHPYIADMAMFLSPLPIVLEWHCVMCDKFFREEVL